MSTRSIAVVAACCLAFVACGSSDHGKAGGSLLAGDPAASAADALPDVSPVRADPGDVRQSLLLTRLSVVLRADATVGQVNDAAALAGATSIAFSRKGAPWLTLALPRKSSGADLQAIADSLRDAPGILAATPGRQLASHVLPEDNGHPVSTDDVDHLLATGFPAAWNVLDVAQKDCSNRKVTLVVPDFYLGTPPSDFQSQVPGALDSLTIIEPLSPDPSILHGFEVLGTAAGAFDGTIPTGADPLPGCLDTRPVNLFALDAFQAVAAMRSAIEGVNGRAVMNASLGFENKVCGPNFSDPCAAEEVNEALAPRLLEEILVRAEAGIEWAEFAMQPQVVKDTLLVVSAGNDRASTPSAGALGELYPGFRNANLTSPFSLGASLSGLASILSNPELWTVPADPGLPSLLLDATVVGSLVLEIQARVAGPITRENLTLVGSTTSQPNFADLQRSAFSNDGADLYAVGQNVGVVGLQLRDGTSFAAPQVAGLATYLWLLDDDLRTTRPVSATLDRIRATSRNNGAVQGIIDAYAATLSVDAAAASHRLRLALVDANADGNFDHLDLALFAAAFHLADSQPPPPTLDYSREDLNGDGFTGGTSIAGVDLDAGPLDGNGAPQLGGVTERIEGYDVDMSEAALSDLQVLCYYAYSDLYARSPVNHDEAVTERTSILGPDRCVTARMDVTFPADLSGSMQLSAVVQVPSSGGQYRPAPGLLVDFVGTCATLQPAQATTDASGAVSTVVTPSAGCRSVTIDLTARASEGSPPLARKTVTSTAPVPQIQVTTRESQVYLIAGGSSRNEGDDKAMSASFFQSESSDAPNTQEWEQDHGDLTDFNPEQSSAMGYTIPGATGSYEASGKLTEDIHADPSGSGLTGGSVKLTTTCTLSVERPMNVSDSCDAGTSACSMVFASAQSEYDLDFTIVKGTYTFTLSGMLDLRKDFGHTSRGNSDGSLAIVRLIARPVGGPGSTVFGADDLYGRNLPGDPGSRSQVPVSQSVTMGPGDYQLMFDIESSCGFGSGTQFPNSGDLTFSLTDG